MKVLKFVVLGFIVLTSCIVQQPLSNGQVEVDFEIHNNILVVEGYVNQKWARFVVDTGASVSLLDFNQSKKYKFDYHIEPDGRLTGFGGRTKLMKTSSVTFSLNGEALTQFYASDLRGLNQVLSKSNQRVLGILGSDFLQANNAVIDYQNNQVVLTVQD